MAEASSNKDLQPAVLKCQCAHEYQDEKYGKGMRFHNGNRKKQYTCTVCGTKKSNQ